MVEAVIQREARALGDPTRYRLFRYIADAPRPVGVAELTGYAGLNHNAVRQHLAVLKDAGLVTEETENRPGPGRPRLMYRLHPEVTDRWETRGGYKWLASVLAGAVRRRQGARRAGGGMDAGARPSWPARTIRWICWRMRWHGVGSARPGRWTASESASHSDSARSPRLWRPTRIRSADCTSAWPKG